MGLPNEKVEIVGGNIRIDGKVVTPPAGIGPYTQGGGPQTGCAGSPITLGPDEYFILGDNSPVSYDARFWPNAFAGHQLGAVPRDRIVGSATMIYFPMGRWRVFR